MDFWRSTEKRRCYARVVISAFRSLPAVLVLFLPALAAAGEETAKVGAAIASSGAGPSGEAPKDPRRESASESASEDRAEDGEGASEGPRVLPRRYGVVIESSIGARGFVGDFGKITPPGLLLRVHAGVEIFRWLMPFAEGDLGMTDTSSSQDGSKVRAFPIFSFGGGLRFTVRPTERVGLFVEGSAGGTKAEVPANSLAVLGFRNAESLGLYAGGRIGVEWYQRDRHLALGIHGGARDAFGFKKTIQGTLPLAIDGVLALRYAF